MRKEEIVNEIKKKCGKVEHLPAVGWHFIYEEFYKLKYCSTVVYMVPRA